MRGCRVVVDPPRLADQPCLLQRREPVMVESLVPDLTTERLDERVVVGIVRLAEDQLHAMAVGASAEGRRHEFGAVVETEPLRAPDRPRYLLQHRSRTLAGLGRSDRDGWAHPAQVIDERENLEPPRVGQPTGQEIHAPFSVQPASGRDRDSRQAWSLPRRPGQQRQAFRAIESVGSLVVDRPALAPREDVPPPVAVAHPRSRQITQPHPQPKRGLIVRYAPLALDRAAQAEDVAGPPLVELEAGPQEEHLLPPLGRLQRVLRTTSCSMCL